MTLLTLLRPTSVPPLLETLTEDFSAASVDTAKWPNLYGPPTQSNGRGVMAVTSAYRGFATGYGYDGRDSLAKLEVVTPPNAGNGSTQAYLSVRKANNDRAQIILDGAATLRFQKFSGGVEDTTSLAFDAVAHRWWRVREAAGTVYWDTSPDGTTWTNRRSLASWIDFNGVGAEIGAGFYGTEPAPGTFEIDNFNLNPPPAGGTIQVLTASGWVAYPTNYYNGTAWVPRTITRI